MFNFLIIIKTKCPIDRFDQREEFTQSQRGFRKLPRKLGRDNSQGYFRYNQPVKEGGGTHILSTEFNNKKKKARLKSSQQN
jgi:hypothetical protein